MKWIYKMMMIKLLKKNSLGFSNLEYSGLLQDLNLENPWLSIQKFFVSEFTLNTSNDNSHTEVYKEWSTNYISHFAK